MFVRAAVRAARPLARSQKQLFAVRAMSQHAPADASLWDRMGGEPVFRKMVPDIVDMHTSDPLTKNYFGEGKFQNDGARDHVIERVFTFFSAGVGGPYDYEGSDMVSAHAGMKITAPAFHGLLNHVMVQMERHQAGGHEEREEVLGILYSLKDDVLQRSDEDIHPYDPKSEPTSGDALAESRAPADASLWDRMGGEEVIRPMITEIVGLHTTDPLTANYFGPGKFKNNGDLDYVINRVFTFFSSGVGGPYEYEGADMIETHRGMQINLPAFHAICNHVLVKMEEHRAGGHREREEIIDILHSLKDDVFAKVDEPQPDNEEGYIKFDPKA